MIVINGDLELVKARKTRHKIQFFIANANLYQVINDDLSEVPQKYPVNDTF